jgi:hypothetical protein
MTEKATHLIAAGGQGGEGERERERETEVSQDPKQKHSPKYLTSFHSAPTSQRLHHVIAL